MLAGEDSLFFQDDQGPPFVANPYLTQWIGAEYALPCSALVVRPGDKPALLVHRPEDYWHAPGPLPGHLDEDIEVEVFDSADTLAGRAIALTSGQKAAVVGPGSQSGNERLGDVNPSQLINRLAFRRASKTDYELEQMRRASRVGADRARGGGSVRYGLLSSMRVADPR